MIYETWEDVPNGAMVFNDSYTMLYIKGFPHFVLCNSAKNPFSEGWVEVGTGPIGGSFRQVDRI